MEQIANGEPLEPILVRFDGESYFVQDGFHRVEAARRSGISQIDAEISPGTPQEMEGEFRKFLDALKTDLSSRA
jgi:ParB-like chromosome segregation protein Spo0J